MVDAQTTAVRGEISTRMYDLDDLEAQHDDYHDLSRDDQHRVAESVEPVEQDTSSNVVCAGMLEWLADAINGASVNPPEPSHFAVGRSTADPSVSDRSLDDEVDRVGVTRFSDEGTAVRITSYVGESEANVDTASGETISEGGVYAADRLLNRSLFNIHYEKDETKTMSIEAVFTFESAGANQ